MAGSNETSEQTSLISEQDAIAHWSVYGRPGCSPSSRVKSSDWKTRPFISPITANWSVPLQLPQVQALMLGFRPQEMEDKWFVHAEGPDGEGRVQVHMYRSWTGYKIVQMDITGVKGEADGAKITGLVYETSKDVLGEQSEENAKTTAAEICRWVLGVTLPIGTYPTDD